MHVVEVVMELVDGVMSGYRSSAIVDLHRLRICQHSIGYLDYCSHFQSTIYQHQCVIMFTPNFTVGTLLVVLLVVIISSHGVPPVNDVVANP
jgi:hypothetical protein